MVSDDGRVLNKKRNKWLNPKKEKKGYYRVGLHTNGKTSWKYVHRLVAESFLQNPDGMPFVNHKDECKENNSVSNLEWCTVQYNDGYGTRNIRVKEIMQKRHGKPIAQFKDGIEIAKYSCINEAARQTGFGVGNISRVCSGKAKTAYGFKWIYV